VPDPFAFARVGYEPAAELRTDSAALARLWADPDARVIRLLGEQFRVEDDAPVWQRPEPAEPLPLLFLGLVDGAGRWADPDATPPPDLATAPGRLMDLRTVAGELNELDGSLLAAAVALAGWHRRHPRCSQCGEPTVPAAAGHQRNCPGCGAEHFPRTDPAIIVLVTDDEGQALLGRGVGWPEGRYSTLAGFVEPGESLEDAVRREVFEESGIRLDDVRYLASQPWPFPASLMVGFEARASSSAITIQAAELADCRWFTREAGARLIRPGLSSISQYLMRRWLERG